MAPGRKTGGRDFPRGNRGRPVGAKDRVPRTLRSMVAALYQEHGPELQERILKGMLSREAYRYFGIAAALEKQQHELSGPNGGPIPTIVHEHHD